MVMHIRSIQCSWLCSPLILPLFRSFLMETYKGRENSIMNPHGLTQLQWLSIPCQCCFIKPYPITRLHFNKFLLSDHFIYILIRISIDKDFFKNITIIPFSYLKNSNSLTSLNISSMFSFPQMSYKFLFNLQFVEMGSK